MSNKIFEQNQRYYDAEASVYDGNRYMTTAGKRVEAFHKRIIDESLQGRVVTGNKVLELGCGTGRLMSHLIDRSYQLHGIDLSPAMLEVARKHLKVSGESVELHQGNVLELPFSEQSFRAVYSILVINLIPDFRSAFKEVARILEPDGLFLFNVPNIVSIYCLGGLYVNARRRTVTTNNVVHRYSHWFSPSEWRGALIDAGFTVECVVGQPPHIRWIDNADPINAEGVGLLFSKSIYILARRVR